MSRRTKSGKPISETVDEDISAELRLQYDHFIRLYCQTLNAGRSVREAGYWSANRASSDDHGCWLLTVPYIKKRVEARLATMLARYQVRDERIAEEMRKCAMSNMRDYVKVLEDGSAVVDLSELDHDQFAAIQELTSEYYTEGKGDEAVAVKKVKIKLANKDRFVEMLAKTRFHKLFPATTTNLNVSGADGQALIPTSINITFTDPPKVEED